MPTTLPRHILLLPLLFLLSFLYPWQVQHHARHSIYAQGGVAEAARPATQGNIDVTLDNRLLSEDGHKSIAEDIKRNEFLIESVADVVTKEAFEIGDTLDHIDEVQKDLTVQKQMALLEDGKYIRALGDGTPEQKQAALNQYAKIYADTYGISIEQAKVIATNKYLKGATHNQQGNNNIYINDNAQKNATDYAHTMGHEVTHARINQGAARDRGSHRLNEQYADTMGEYSADGMEFSNNTYTNNAKIDRHTTTNTHRGNRNSQLLKTNTQGFVDVVKRDGGNVEYSTYVEANEEQLRAAEKGIPTIKLHDSSAEGGYIVVVQNPTSLRLASKDVANISEKDRADLISGKEIMTMSDIAETGSMGLAVVGAGQVVVRGGSYLIKKGNKYFKVPKSAVVKGKDGKVYVKLTKQQRDKIKGTAQGTGTPGHKFRSYREAIKEAKKDDVIEVHMDHGYNRALDLPPKTVKPNRRPDVTSVTKDKEVQAIEVKSKTDRKKDLKQRNNILHEQLIKQGFKPKKTKIKVPTKAKK